MNYYTLTNYRKIGGFLRVFQVFAIIDIVYTSINLLSKFSTFDSYYSTALSLFQIFVSALYLLTRIFDLVFLNQRKKYLPLFYLLTHISLVVLGYLNAYFISSQLNFYSYYASTNYVQIFGSTITLIITFCVFAYFKKSERYKIYTMSEPEYLELYAYYGSHLSFDYPGMNMGQQGYGGQSMPQYPQQPYYPTQGAPYPSPQPYGNLQYQSPPVAGGQIPPQYTQQYGGTPYPAPTMNGQASAPFTQPAYNNPQQVPPASYVPAPPQPAQAQQPVANTMQAPSVPSQQADDVTQQSEVVQSTYTGHPLPKFAPQAPAPQVISPHNAYGQENHANAPSAQPGQPLPTYTGQPLPYYPIAPQANPYAPSALEDEPHVQPSPVTAPTPENIV